MKGNETMMQIAEKHIAATNDPTYPVFYVLPKSAISTMFPPRKNTDHVNSHFGPWSTVMAILGISGAFTSLF